MEQNQAGSDLGLIKLTDYLSCVVTKSERQSVKPRYSELHYSEILAITKLPRSQNYFAI